MAVQPWCRMGTGGNMQVHIYLLHANSISRPISLDVYGLVPSYQPNVPLFFLLSFMAFFHPTMLHVLLRVPFQNPHLLKSRRKRRKKGHEAL